MPIDELKDSIIDLYQYVKIRKKSEEKNINETFLEKERISLSTISSKILIDYIKTHINLLIELKVNEKIAKLKINPIDYICSNGSNAPIDEYEKLLRRYESDIRNYIKYVNMLKIHIEELNQKQEILENQIDELQNKALDLIPTTQSIEYKKRINELTSMIKKYENHSLKIPLLEEKIKFQKIELDKLDNYYKKQIKNYTKKLEEYEKGIYLNKNCHNLLKKKIFKSNFNTSVYQKKSKNRIYSISPKKDSKTKSSRFTSIENDHIQRRIKKTKSINNIFFDIKNNEIKQKIEENISNNINNKSKKTNSGMISTQNTIVKEPIIFSPKFNENNMADNYYDSIETENNNKTINIAGTATNFRNTINLKSNPKILKEKKLPNGIKSKSKLKKGLNSNRSSTKIPKIIPENINTSKFTKTKEKNIPKICRYNSLRQLTNNHKKTLNLKKNGEPPNIAFSRTTNISTGANTNNNTIKSQRNDVKKFILNKINNNTNNGRTQIPIKKIHTKASTFIK